MKLYIVCQGYILTLKSHNSILSVVMPLGEIKYEGKLPPYLPLLNFFASEKITNTSTHDVADTIHRHNLGVQAEAIPVDAEELLALSEAYLRFFGGDRSNGGFSAYPDVPFYGTELHTPEKGRARIYRGGNQRRDIAIFEFFASPQDHHLIERIQAETTFNTSFLRMRTGPIKTRNITWKVTTQGGPDIQIPSIVHEGYVPFSNDRMDIGVPVEQMGLRKLVERLWEIGQIASYR